MIESVKEKVRKALLPRSELLTLLENHFELRSRSRKKFGCNPYDSKGLRYSSRQKDVMAPGLRPCFQSSNSESATERTQLRLAKKQLMKIKSLIAISIISAAISAQAIPIDLGTQNGSPANQGSRLERLNEQIDIYNAANNPDLPEAVLAESFRSGPQTGTSISIDVTGWTYLVLKWSNLDRYWYVGGDTGVLTFLSTAFNSNNQPQNLSGYSLFNPTSSVPDAGTTLVLLGGSLIGLGALRRRFSK